MKKALLAVLILSGMIAGPACFAEEDPKRFLGIEAGAYVDIPRASDPPDGSGVFPIGVKAGAFMGLNRFLTVFANLNFDAYGAIGPLSWEFGVRLIPLSGKSAWMEASISNVMGFGYDIFSFGGGEDLEIGTMATLGIAWEMGTNVAFSLRQGAQMELSSEGMAFSFPTLLSCRFYLLAF